MLQEGMKGMYNIYHYIIQVMLSDILQAVSTITMTLSANKQKSLYSRHFFAVVQKIGLEKLGKMQRKIDWIM